MTKLLLHECMSEYSSTVDYRNYKMSMRLQGSV